MITEDYPPGLLTGIGRHVQELAESLSETRAKVSVVKAGAIARTDVPPKFRILGAEPPAPIASLPWREGPCNLPATVHNNLAMIELILRDRAKYDVVHIHDIFASLAGFTVASALGLPTVFTKNFCLPPQRMVRTPSDTLRYFMRLEDWSLHAADQLIAVSEYVQRIILSRDDGLREKCAVVTNGTNIVQATRMCQRVQSRELLASHLGVKEPLGLLLLHVGRLVYSKGADVSLHALRSLLRDARACDPRLVMVGSGPPRYETYLRRLASHLGVAHRVHFFGPEYSRSALADMYRAADAVLAPSRSESFSLVIAEATSLCRLIVAANVGGNPEQIVHMRNGLLFRHGPDAVASGNALAELIKWAAANPVEAARIAEAGPLHGQDTYSWPSLAKKVSNLYDEVIHRRAERARGKSAHVASGRLR